MRLNKLLIYVHVKRVLLNGHTWGVGGGFGPRYVGEAGRGGRGLRELAESYNILQESELRWVGVFVMDKSVSKACRTETTYNNNTTDDRAKRGHCKCTIVVLSSVSTIETMADSLGK